MSNYVGRKIAAGIAYESVRGTAEAAPDFWLRILSQNHKDKVEYLHSQGATGTIIENASAEIDKQWGEGGFDAEIDADSIGLMMLALMGDVDSAAEGDGYLHTFDLDETSAEHQSLTIFTDEPGRDVVYPLACLNTLSFNFERGKILDFSASFLSQTGVAGSSTPAFTESKHFRPKDFHVYLADDIAGLDVAAEVFLKTMSLEFNKNLEPDDVLGLESPRNFLNKTFSTTASINLFYEDDTYRTYFKAGTPKAMRIKIVNPNSVITDAIAATGSFTVVDYSALTGKTVTVGTTTLTEGTDWDAETSNEVTATNLAAAITALANVNAVADGADVDVTAATAGVAGNSIATTTNGGSDLTAATATLQNGADAVNDYIVFDFARVYFSEYDEGNGRDDIKSMDITLSFATNSDEETIPFGQVRILNETASYTA